MSIQGASYPILSDLVFQLHEAFIENNYKVLKTKNPRLPILSREATGIQPQLWARFVKDIRPTGSMAKSSFKLEHHLDMAKFILDTGHNWEKEERRQAESACIREKYPDRVPVNVEKAIKSEVPDIDEKKSFGFSASQSQAGSSLIFSVCSFARFLGFFVSRAVGLRLQFNSMSDGCVSVRHLLKSLSLLQKLTISESQKAPDCKEICGWGVVAAESISKRDFVVEYVGEA
ncbi:hypothetical protein OROMI_008054 [Orobanche minor]